MATPFDETSLTLRWGKLAARAYGQGPTVLCLHGWLDNAASFDPLVPLLPEGFRYLSVDLAGHGLSDHRPSGVNYHYWDYVADLVETLDVLGERPITLLGHSLGGTVAAVVAGVLPERVRQLVLLDSLGPLSAPPEEGPDRLRRFLLASRKVAASASTRYKTLDEAVSARRRAGTLSEASARLLVNRNAFVDGDGVRWRSDRRLLLNSPSRLTESQVLAFLESIRCETLVVRAEPGMAIPPVDWSRRLAAVKTATLVGVPGDHHVHMDAPERVAPVVAAFLR